MSDERMILIIGSDRESRNIEQVCEHLNRTGEEFFVFYTGTFPTGKKITLRLGGNQSPKVAGSLREKNSLEALRIEEIKSAWFRRPEYPQAAAELPQWQMKFVQDESRAALYSLYSTLPCFWMNHPFISVRLLEHNKLYQLDVAQQLGLTVPETIITNDTAELLAFCRECGGSLAVKCIQGHAYRERKTKTAFGLFTSRVTFDELAAQEESIAYAPVFAQRYIPKKIELRITVVGERFFSCAIHSQESERTKHDWRNYDFEKVRHEPYELPKEIEAKLRELMRFWRLSFGALDMIVTPSGEYVFLEINPGGQWGWIEDLAGLPISRAIAETLAAAPAEVPTMPF